MGVIDSGHLTRCHSVVVLQCDTDVYPTCILSVYFVKYVYTL